MKICIHNAEICFEGSMSQNFDIGLSLCFMVCITWNFEKYAKNPKSCPFFFIKQKLELKQKI